MIISHIPKLRAMAKQGLINLHSDTGATVRHWTGQEVTACYIDGVPEGKSRQFEYKGEQYKVIFLDGCFCPFVCTMDTDENGFA